MQSEQEDGEVEVDVAVSDGFVHVEEEVEVDGGSDVVGAGDEGGSVGSSETGGVLVGNSLEEEPLELRTTLCALAGSPSLEARVTSMKSALPDERGSDFFSRNSALRLAFLLIAEGLFLFTALAAVVRLSLVSKENAKVEPIVSEKVKTF